MDVVNLKPVSVDAGNFTSSISNNPLDFDNRVVGACIFLPSGVAKDRGVLHYCTDKKATLIRYDNNDTTIGAAVCLSDGDKFFVNSIEGSPALRDNDIFNIILSDVTERAKASGAKQLIFYSNPTNGTPREFVEFLNDKGIKTSDVNFSVGDFKGHTDIPVGRTAISGYVVYL